MKKLLKIFVPILAISAASILGSCDKHEKQQRVLLSYGDIHSSGVIDHETISSKELRDKIVVDKESILLAISSDNCGCWSDFRPLLNNYIMNNNLICYHKTYSEFKDYMSELKIEFEVGHVTLAIIENGAAKFNIIHDYEKEETTVQSEFDKLMDSLIIKPKFYYINEEDYFTMKASDKTELVYFARSKCGDCNEINRTILNEYVHEKEFDQSIYVLDCQKYLATETYQDKKHSFGMSESANPKYGFSQGVFPFFSLIQNGEYISGAVAYNETLEMKDGKVVVSESYYDETRVQNLTYTDYVLTGKTIPEGEYNYDPANKEYSWIKKYATNEYRGLIYSFLDYALPQVTYSI